MHGRPAVREYLGARRIHACMLFSEGERAPGLLLPTISSSSRTEMKCRVCPLHFISVTLPLLLGCRCVMQGNLLLLTDKVVWYSTQHSTVRTCAADTAALGRQGKKLLPPSKKNNINLAFRGVKQFQILPNLYKIILIFVLQYKYL